jgi:hypothetical protein
MTDIAQGLPPDGGERAATTSSTTSAGQTAKQATSQVAASAAEQGRQVLAETGYQARNLMRQARSEVTGQASVQKKRAVEGLYAFGDELGKLANRSEGAGPATQLVQHASNRVGNAARWLDEREPGQVVDEVKAYARRNPGLFLLGAAVLGTLAGRLTRNIVQEHQDQHPDDERAVGVASPPNMPTTPGVMPATGGYPAQSPGYPGGGATGMPAGQQPPMPPMSGTGPVEGGVRP